MTDNLADVLARFRPAWMRHAACAGMDQDIFFPPLGHNGDAAKRYCQVCPSRAECLAFGLTDDAGIFGGLNVKAREKLHASGWTAGDPLPPIVFAAKAHGTPAAIKRHRDASEVLCAECQDCADRSNARWRRRYEERRLRAVGEVA